MEEGEILDPLNEPLEPGLSLVVASQPVRFLVEKAADFLAQNPRLRLTLTAQDKRMSKLASVTQLLKQELLARKLVKSQGELCERIRIFNQRLPTLEKLAHLQLNLSIKERAPNV